MKTLLTVLMTACMMFGAVSAASAADINTRSVDHETVMTMGKALKLSNGVVPTPAELAVVCDDPALALMAVVDNNKIRDGIRRFALQALTQFDEDERVFSYFENRLNSVNDKDTWKLMLLTFAQTFGERAVDSLAPLLTSSRNEKQLVAIEALGMFGGQAGYDLLKELLATDTLNEDVKSAIGNFVW